MTYDRRGDRRPGGGRPSGQRSGGGRSDRPPRSPEGFGGGQRGGYPQGSSGGGRSFERGSSFAPRPRDEGGMSIRLDPRRLAALKLLAGEQGLRPGELVTRWVEERLDAARSGQPMTPRPVAASGGAGSGVVELAALSRRVDELAERLEAFTTAAPAPAPAATAEAAPPAQATSASIAPVTKRRGRPPKAAATGDGGPKPAAEAGTPRVPLHEEIISVISERGPMTAGELADAIRERGRYSSPRSAKPFDAATVNARVSNPVYRSRFTRDKGRIGLASAS